MWVSPTACPEISTMMKNIRRRWGRLWFQARERTVTAVTQDKHVLLYFDLFCRLPWISVFFFPFPPPQCLNCRFYLHYKISWSFSDCFSFFSDIFIPVINLCLNVGLLHSVECVCVSVCVSVMCVLLSSSIFPLFL